MDTITGQLVAFTTGFSARDVPVSARGKAVEVLFDAIACCVAGCGSGSAEIVADIAPRLEGRAGATVFGHGFTTTLELAALANSMMVHTYDYNDAFFGHPSDMIPGVLAVGEDADASGAEVLVAICLAYEIYGAFARSAPYHLDGWLDQGAFMNVAVALATGKLWRLSADQLAHAASLALVPNLPLGVARWGTLSMLKGAATAFAVRNGVFAAMLARRGFSSAPDPYEGRYGLHHAIGFFELNLPLMPEPTRVIELPYLKPLPAENNAIGVLELASEIRTWAPVDTIDAIEIEVATGLEVQMGDEPKYDPTTRETADHSLPFMLARALVDGEINLGTFTPEKISDPELRPLMRKIRLRGSDAMKATMRESRGTEAKPARVRVTAGGREYLREIVDHSGHPGRPTAERRAMLNHKLDLCARHVGVADEQREQIRHTWWSVAEAAHISDAIATLANLDCTGGVDAQFRRRG